MLLRSLAIVSSIGLAVACAPTPPTSTAPTTTRPAPTTQAPTTTKAPTTTQAPTTTAAAPTTTAPTNAATGDPFNITLELYGDASIYQAEIDAAVARWESIITQGHPDAHYNLPANYCFGEPATARSNFFIDDIVVEIRMKDIDGVGKVLGSAGYCRYRGNKSPLVGALELDTADAESLKSGGRLVDTLVHEIGHILGIGTGWGDGLYNLLEGTKTSSPTFTGAHAIAEWHALGGTGGVPVHPDDLTTKDDDGTALGHWDETTFGDELMTGFLTGSTRPLSRLSIASLADLGYKVDLTKADPFSWSAPSNLWGLMKAMALSGDHHDELHTDLLAPPADGVTAQVG